MVGIQWTVNKKHKTEMVNLWVLSEPEENDSIKIGLKDPILRQVSLHDPVGEDVTALEDEKWGFAAFAAHILNFRGPLLASWLKQFIFSFAIGACYHHSSANGLYHEAGFVKVVEI